MNFILSVILILLSILSKYDCFISKLSIKFTQSLTTSSSLLIPSTSLNKSPSNPTHLTRWMSTKPTEIIDSYRYINGYNSRQIISKVDDVENPCMILGIAGGSGSGKTTLTNAIISELGDEYVTTISHDSYYKDFSYLSLEERDHLNWDTPNSLDSELLELHLQQLKLGKSVQIPVYDFKTHSRLTKTIEVKPKRIIIVDGILIFAEKGLIDQMDMKIYVDTEDDIRLIRRIQRDTTERQRTVQSVIDQYVQTVRPMHHLYVEPSKRYADIIVPAGKGIQAVALDMCVSRLREIINFYQ